jgi:hypothetical protein
MLWIEEVWAGVTAKLEIDMTSSAFSTFSFFLGRCAYDPAGFFK